LKAFNEKGTEKNKNNSIFLTHHLDFERIKKTSFFFSQIFVKKYCQSKKTFYLCASFLKAVFIDE